MEGGLGRISGPGTATRTIAIEAADVEPVLTLQPSGDSMSSVNGGAARGSGSERGGSVVRLDPSQIMIDFLSTAMMRSVSDSAIEVEAVIVRNRVSKNGENSVPGSPVRDPQRLQQSVSSAELQERVGPAIGFVPTEVDDASWAALPASAPVAQLRPTPFFPLDGRKTPVPVPAGSADLSAEWCTLAFRSRGHLDEGETIVRVSTRPLGEGEGEFSELVLLTIEEVAGGPANRLPRHLVAKFSPPDMSALERAAVFSPEAHFYNDFTIASGGLVRPPTVYVGYLKRRWPATPFYCIIMESACPPTRPTRSFKRVEGCDSVEYLLLAMRTLARFHARWWGMHNKLPATRWAVHPDNAGGALPTFPKCIAHAVWITGFKNGLKALPHCFSDRPPYGGAPKFGEQYAPFLAAVRTAARRRRAAIVAELFKHPLTLTHGDAHLENIFFGPQYPGGCAFIDFGLTMFGQALSDVATVLGGGLEPELRRAHEKALVEAYHKCLVEFGVKGYSHEAAWRDYEFQMILPFVRLLVMAPGLAKDRRKRRGMFAESRSPAAIKLSEMYVQLNERFATALMDLGWPARCATLPVTANGCWRPCC